MDKLRLGVAIASDGLEAWEVQAVRGLVDGGFAELVVLMRMRSGTKTSSGWGTTCWRAFSAAMGGRASKRCGFEDAFGGFQVLDESDTGGFAASNVDVLLTFGVPSDALRYAGNTRYGVWSFAFGGENGWREGPACFWELLRGERITAAALVRHTPGKSAVVLREGFLKAVDYVYGRSVDNLCFECARWPSYAARDIANGISSGGSLKCGADVRPWQTPSNGAVAALACRLTRNVIRRLFERRMSEEWSIGAARLTVEQLLAGTQLEEVRWLAPLEGSWVADPMAVRSNGTIHVLCEEMDLPSRRGQISATSFDGSAWSLPKRVIPTATHASYPYLFEHEGSVFCIPETYEAKEIALYRAVEFPTRWTRQATLIENVAAIDTTLFRHDGRLWMFCTTEGASNTALCAFYAEELLGPWTPHAANPVKIDVRGARPAGPPFRVGDRLYRPAQDSSRTYGGRVVVNRVMELTTKTFEEQPCAFVEPPRSSPYGLGLHTLSFAGDYCIIDGKRAVRSRAGDRSGRNSLRSLAK